MDISSVITLIGSMATSVATIVLAILTGKYVKLTHALVDETKATKFPNVYVDVEFDSFEVKFIVGNAGASPAIDVSLKIKDSVPWRVIDNYPTGLNALAIVKHGINYLAPGRILKYQAGYIEHDADFFASGNTIEVTLEFKTETGITVNRQFTIDLHSYSGVLFESFQNSEREVAKAIRDAEHHRSSRDPMKSIISRFVKVPCPSCGEQISHKAKKCPKCHEFIETKENDENDS